VHCASLASKEKKIGLEMKLADQEGDEANWWLEKHRVGPTIPLRRLLAQINFLLYVFHAEVGVQNRKR
jgi:hypothetical protein